jgi:hypothetical protein
MLGQRPCMCPPNTAGEVWHLAGCQLSSSQVAAEARGPKMPEPTDSRIATALEQIARELAEIRCRMNVRGR